MNEYLRINEQKLTGFYEKFCICMSYTSKLPVCVNVKYSKHQKKKQNAECYNSDTKIENYLKSLSQLAIFFK